MSFALPAAFWLAACAAPIIVFYILKVRLRRQPVSTNLFWKQIYDEKPPRSIWQYLRHLLSLLVQLFVLALLVLAIADPYLPWELLQARRIVVVVDRSASMQAADVAPTRFDAAIDAAVAVVDGLRFRDEMAIVAGGPQPEVLIGMSSHVPTLKRALRDIEVSDNPTDLAAAIELGKELVGEHPHGVVLVYTDGCVEGELAKADAPSNPDLDVAKKQAIVKRSLFGTRASNVGITQLQVRRSLVDPLGYEALVSVSNASDKDVECRLEIELESVPVDVVPLKLKPNEKWRRSLQKTSIDGGKLSAKLTQIALPKPPDEKAKAEEGRTDADDETGPTINGLNVDDTAWAILAPRKPQRVLLVTEGNLFLQKVFQANPLVKCDVVKAIPEKWPADTIIVLHRQVPPDLPPGDLFVVEPAADCSAWDIGDTMENPIITQQQTDSPLMAHVRLDNMLMPAAKRLAFKSPPQILAGTLGGDAIFASLKRDKGKCLVLSVDLDKSDLAFRTAFPIMVTNALNWFCGGTGEMQGSLATGHIAKVPIEDEKLSKNATLVLRSPTGRESKIARPEAVERDLQRDSSDGLSAKSDTSTAASAASSPDVSLGPIDECGIWTLVAKESPEREAVTAEFAVNLANERESDLRPREELKADSTAATLAGSWFVRPLWFYIAACVCAITVVEWLLHQRRVIT
jgi:hypothetical protein